MGINPNTRLIDLTVGELYDVIAAATNAARVAPVAENARRMALRASHPFSDVHTAPPNA